MAVLVRNTTADRDVDTITVPRQENGTSYRYEVIWDKYRAYGQNAEDLLTMIIPGYDLLTTEEEKLQSRLLFTVRQQVTLQASINSEYDLDEECGVWERAVLFGSRDVPPAPSEWTTQVPLVLIDIYYEPLGEIAQPKSSYPSSKFDNIIWLRVTNSDELIRSLHAAGVVTLNEAVGT